MIPSARALEFSCISANFPNGEKDCASSVRGSWTHWPQSIRRHWTVCFRSEEHTSELQSLMRISYAVFCLKKKKKNTRQNNYRATRKALTINSSIRGLTANHTYRQLDCHEITQQH